MPPEPPADFASSNENTPAVTATGTNGAQGINATSDSGTALETNSTSGNGLAAISSSGIGVVAGSTSGNGLFAESGSGIGVHAVGGGAGEANPPPVSQAAILAEGGPSPGVYATSDTDTAVFASSTSGPALEASSTSATVIAASGGGGAPCVTVSAAGTGVGIEVRSNTGTAVVGSTVTSTGVAGSTDTGIGVSANGGAAGVALQVIGKIQVQGNSVGSETLKAKTSTLKVSSASATPNSLIFLTPLDNPQAFLWISARSAGSFTIEASTAPSKDVTIGFLIIN